MTSIDFHVLTSATRESQLEHVCRLTEKALRNGHKILIFTDSPAITQTLDELLWAFRPETFIPHTTKLSESDSNPVFITNNKNPGNFHDILINASGGAPPTFFSQFERAFEVVIQEESFLKQSRNNFKFYKSRGYTIKTENI